MKSQNKMLDKNIDQNSIPQEALNNTIINIASMESNLSKKTNFKP